MSDWYGCQLHLKICFIIVSWNKTWTLTLVLLQLLESTVKWFLSEVMSPVLKYVERLTCQLENWSDVTSIEVCVADMPVGKLKWCHQYWSMYGWHASWKTEVMSPVLKYAWLTCQLKNSSDATSIEVCCRLKCQLENWSDVTSIEVCIRGWHASWETEVISRVLKYVWTVEMPVGKPKWCHQYWSMY